MPTGRSRSSRLDRPRSKPPLTLLLYELQSPINIGMILRVAETYRVGIAIYGSRSVLESAERMKVVSDFACGALERVGYRRLARPADLEKLGTGARLVATSVEEGTTPLPDFRFRRGDVVVLGNEYDGLPARVLESCKSSLRIPMADVWAPKPQSHNPIDAARAAPVARDGMPNLNVAVAGGIICYQWFRGRAG